MTDLFLALPVLLFSMVAHEYAHGFAALTQGDDTAKALGRLTLNPVKHIDPWMSVLLPLLLWFGSGGRFVFGGAKPVPVNPANYRRYRRGDVIVSSAGIVTNLFLAGGCVLLAIVVGVLAHGTGAAAGMLVPVQRALFWGIWLNLLLAVFNVLPIPPLDGSHLMYHALPASLRAGYRRAAPYGMLILLAIVMFAPRVLGLLLTPALLLYDTAAAVVRPYAIAPFPL